MGRGLFNVLTVIIVVVMFSLSGCGGGGAASTTTQNPNAISTATFSGKSFAMTGGTITFNADGTLSGVGVNTTNEAWTINASGQLVISGTSKGTETVTLTGDATHGWTGNMVYSDGTTATLTLVPTTTPTPSTGFTTAMLAGKTVTSPNGAYVDTDVFNANGTYTETRTNPNSPGINSGTWSINSAGQLIMTTTASQYQTLNVPTTLTLTSATSTALTMSANNTVYVLTYK